ncbi:MAG TPA: HD domain-containing protein, partial [Nitrospirae bacterium]|nr:HD domain-containing protein [Nitrospirota bacterium]
LIEDIEKERGIRKKNAPQYNTKSLLCLPVVINGKTAGVLSFNNKASGENFNKKDLYLASVITERISNMIGKVLKGDLRSEEYKLTVKGMEALSNAERVYKKKNGKLTDLVIEIMQSMRQSEDEIKLALYASRLYDLGLTQIDESILSKTNGLSDIDKKIIRTHPFPGVRLIDPLEPHETVKKIILHHHERYDGSGYPDGLKGEEIPFISRVLSVVDTYTAMTADRPYRKAVSGKEAIEEIMAGSGTQFDPGIVDAFTQIT